MTKDLIKFENEEFPISYKAAEVDFQGYEALDAKVDAMTKDWDKYVVTAESYPYDKKTRAELNRIRRALSDRRKVIVKESSQQITEFNTKVKGLDLKIKGVVDHLSEGLKTFDEQARKDKHQQNLLRLGELAKEYGVALQELDYQDKWDIKKQETVSKMPKIGLKNPIHQKMRKLSIKLHRFLSENTQQKKKIKRNRLPLTKFSKLRRIHLKIRK